MQLEEICKICKYKDKANKYDNLAENIKEKVATEIEEMKHFDKTGDSETAKMHAYAIKILQELEE